MGGWLSLVKTDVLIRQARYRLPLTLHGASLGSRLRQILIRVGLTEPSHEGTTGTPWGDQLAFQYPDYWIHTPLLEETLAIFFWLATPRLHP